VDICEKRGRIPELSGDLQLLQVGALRCDGWKDGCVQRDVRLWASGGDVETDEVSKPSKDAVEEEEARLRSWAGGERRSSLPWLC
jgi:hypothetical protein